MLRYVEAGLVKEWLGRQGVLRYRLVLACYALVSFGRHG